MKHSISRKAGQRPSLNQNPQDLLRAKDAAAFLGQYSVQCEEASVDVFFFYDAEGRAIGQLILDPFILGPHARGEWPELLQEVA